MQSLFARHALSLLVHVATVSCARRLPIKQDTKTHRASGRCGAYHQMRIAGVKAVGDALLAARRDALTTATSSMPSRSPVREQKLSADATDR